MKSKLLKLVSEMTIQEKAAQCTIITSDFFEESGEVTGPMEIMKINQEQVSCIGSIIGITDQKMVKKIQEKYLKNSRTKIPLLFMSDIIHGCKTIFPVPLALSGSFEPELAYKVAKLSGKESAILGNHVTYSPMADLARDARWGRNMESNGEDPYLNAMMTSAYVRGYQGNNLKDKYSVASCVKHFAGYSNVKSGREYDFVDLSERILREYHISGYKAGIDAGARMVMTSFNTINSIPATANKWLFRDLLRDELGFKGTVISDWGAVKESINYQIAADEYECAKKSLTAGVNIEMMTPTYINSIVELINTGDLDITVLDKLVYEILELKDDLGLFEDPYRGMSEDDIKFVEGDEIRALALEAAEKSILLLKNENILPLSRSQKVQVAGPFANSKDLNGPWSWQGDISKNTTLEEILIQNNALDTSDIVIYYGGETSQESGEAKSKTDISLDTVQVNQIKDLKANGKKIVLVLNTGRPLVLNDVIDDIDALIVNYFLGFASSNALYNTLYGENNPSAKLTMSFPNAVGQCPIYYNDIQTGRPAEKAIDDYFSGFIDCSNKPLFTFGEGLNYGNISISKIEFSSKEMKVNDKLEVSVELINNSASSAIEVVQLYVRDLVASVVRPVKELKAFEKIMVTDKAVINFTITKDMFKYINEYNIETFDIGEFEIMIGLSSKDVNTTKIKVIKE